VGFLPAALEGEVRSNAHVAQADRNPTRSGGAPGSRNPTRSGGAPGSQSNPESQSNPAQSNPEWRCARVALAAAAHTALQVLEKFCAAVRGRRIHRRTQSNPEWRGARVAPAAAARIALQVLGNTRCKTGMMLARRLPVTHPRAVCPGDIVFVTSRIVARLFLMRPDREMNDAFGYLLAVYAGKYGIGLHAACVQSTHWHGVMSHPYGLLPAFLRDFRPLRTRSGTRSPIRSRRARFARRASGPVSARASRIWMDTR